MKTLRLSPDLTLPRDFATEGVGIIGMRGSGKSNTEVRFAEILFDAGIPWVAVDPKGDWDGIRSSADGKKAGLPIPVFGGLNGDFPLDANGGKVIADLLVDENLSAVLDVSHLSKTIQLPKFLVAFFDQLMYRHQLERQVRTVILEEAHRYIPQKVDSKMALLKEAAAAVLLEGRAFGLGCWACTQRPARINKDVLEEVGTLFVHRIGVAAGNDKKTVRDWVKHEDLGEEMVDSLTKLRPGECWVLAPEFDIVRRVQIDRRHTFDSAATPKVGASASARRPATLADIDKDAITAALSESIEKAKATDPKILAQRVNELERTIRAYEKELEKAKAAKEPEPVAYVPPALLDQLGKLEHGLSDLIADARSVTSGVNTAVDGARAALIAAEKVNKSRPAPDDTRRRESPKPVARTRGQSPRAAGSPSDRGAQPPASVGISDVDLDVDLAAGARKMLGVLHLRYPLWVTNFQLGLMSGFAPSGGTFRTYLGKLKQYGLIDVKDGGRRRKDIRISDTGLDLLGPVDNDQRLVDLVRPALRKGELIMLDLLIAVYPNGMTRGQLGEESGFEPSGGTFRTYLGALRTNGLVEVQGDAVFAAETLFA